MKLETEQAAGAGRGRRDIEVQAPIVSSALR